MEDQDKYKLISGLSTNPNHHDILQLRPTSKQTDHHVLHIHCLDTTKTLKSKKDTSVQDIKQNAFALYDKGGFTDDNAILTYLNTKKVELLLASMSQLSEKGAEDLFIKFVYPACAVCRNPFGIVEGQLLLECPKIKCGEQYCNSCVQAMRGSPSEHPFICISCKKEVIPKRNSLIEEHLIWKSMCKLYGNESQSHLMENLGSISPDAVLANIEFRLIHLQACLHSFQNRVGTNTTIDLFDEMLISDVKHLCENLESLITEINETNQVMKTRCIIVDECLQKYKEGMEGFHRLCDALIKGIEKLEMNDTDNLTDTGRIHIEHIKKLYRMDHLNHLSSEQSIKSIDYILLDLSFRKSFLSARAEIITSLLKNKPDQIETFAGHFNEAHQKLEIISKVGERLNDLRGNLRAIDRNVESLDKLLRHEEFQSIFCSKFILLLEKLRVRTEELEIANNYPETTRLMEKAQDDYRKNEHDQPKVIDLCKALESDVKHLFANSNCIYSIPYKVGVIGAGSVGKSALVMNLINDNQFCSMINLERSTFGYLQFDTFVYKQPENGRVIPITFFDIEGATDIDKSESIGNYIELINKADCDLYIIVIDKPFSDDNRTWQEHIQKNLARKCLIVMSKVDSLFNEKLKNTTRNKYKKNSTTKYEVILTINELKAYAVKAFDGKYLTNRVYLTAAGCDDDNLKDASFIAFDLDDLKKELLRLAIKDLRIERICKLAIAISRVFINTRFRRSDVVSKTRYQVLAAGCSIIPFLDELPAFIGREKVRQVIGVKDNSALVNKIEGTKDSLEEYLTEQKFTVPKTYLKSGYFKYLRPEKLKQTTIPSDTEGNKYINREPTCDVQNRTAHFKNASLIAVHIQNFVARGSTVAGVVINLSDDILSVALPSSVAALRAASTTGIVVGVVLTPLFAAWTFYSTGKRMNDHLHRLCDDLLVILAYFTINVCNDCCKGIELSILLPDDRGSSSFDEE